MLNLKRKNNKIEQPIKKAKTTIKMLDAPPINSILD